MNTNARITPVVAVAPVAITLPVAAVTAAAVTPAVAVTVAPAVFEQKQKEQEPPADQPRQDASSDIEGSARYRLLIEEGPSKGSFVYKTLDSVTGEIVRQFPREQVLRLAEASGYDKGSVINTSA